MLGIEITPTQRVIAVTCVMSLGELLPLLLSGAVACRNVVELTKAAVALQALDSLERIQAQSVPSRPCLRSKNR